MSVNKCLWCQDWMNFDKWIGYQDSYADGPGVEFILLPLSENISWCLLLRVSENISLSTVLTFYFCPNELKKRLALSYTRSLHVNEGGSKPVLVRSVSFAR